MCRAMLANIIWAFSGDGKLKSRLQLSEFVRQSSTLPLPPNSSVRFLLVYFFFTLYITQ